MSNPWKTIPLSDYEGHMTLSHVGQSQMLSNTFRDLLTAHRPKSAAVIGCAGGNGFDEASRLGVERIVGIDINGGYLDQAQARYESKFPAFDLYCLNIEDALPAIPPVALIYAALIFEYVDTEKALANLRKLSQEHGVLAVLLQLPKQGLPAVTSSPYTSLSQLESVMRLVSPGDVSRAAQEAGFVLQSSSTVTLESAKEFALQSYTVAS